MGTIFVDNIKQQSSQGSGTITIGASGETVALASGVKQSNLLTPAFSASMSADQTLTDAAQTKVQFDTENFDTDNAYDHSTNYRFTVPSGKAGKYLIYSTVTGYSNPSRLQYVQTFLFKNGSTVGYSTTDPRNAGFGFFFSCYITKVLDLSVGDYIEIYTTVDPEANGTYDAKLSTTSGGATFGGYRIGS